MNDTQPQLADDEFLQQFENCTLPKTYFIHRGHLRLAWLYLNKYHLDQATYHIINGIKKYAASQGAAHIYHETLTCAWIYLVHDSMLDCKIGSFDEFILAHQHLLDKSLLFQYFTHELLHSDKARQQWVEPDLKPLHH